MIKKYAPNPKLKQYINCYWSINNCFDSEQFNSVNNTYCMAFDQGLDIIFNLSNSPIEAIVDDFLPMIIDKDFIIGSLAKQVKIKPSGVISLFGIRFNHYGLYPFFSMPCVDLSDFGVEIEEVWELNGLGLPELIHNIDPVPEQLIYGFEKFFVKRINDFRKHSINVEKAVQIIRSHKGQITVETLANKLQITTRHLERKFIERIGIPPKQLCRLFRIKTVLVNFNSNKQDLASFAIANGFFDQAHFINEFKFFTGKTPMNHLENNRLPKIFNHDF